MIIAKIEDVPLRIPFKRRNRWGDKDFPAAGASPPTRRFAASWASAAPIWPAMQGLVRYSDPSLVRAKVRRAIDFGFRSRKLHEIELAAIRAAREKAGPDVEH